MNVMQYASDSALRMFLRIADGTAERIQRTGIETPSDHMALESGRLAAVEIARRQSEGQTAA